MLHLVMHVLALLLLLSPSIAVAQTAVAPTLSGITPVYPGAAWSFKTPAELGLDKNKLDAFQSFLGGRGAVVRYGYMAYTWGDQAYKADIASAVKPIFSTFLFKAVEQGKLGAVDQRINTFESCVDGINATLGYKDRAITFRHMANQLSGYGVKEQPGVAFDYNDWQMALFVDTLFLKVWGAGSWSNVDASVLRPQLADALHMQDAPSMNVSGQQPGRVAISVRDFARVGLLYMRKGNWNGNQVLSQQNALRAVTEPVPSSVPRTQAVAAQLCPGQRTIGSTAIPDDQNDHYGSYSWLWWVNGVTPQRYPHYGKSSTHRYWWDAPVDTFAACGHTNCKRGMVVIPSLDLVVSWNDTRLDQSGMDASMTMNELLKRLVSAVVPSDPLPLPVQKVFVPFVFNP